VARVKEERRHVLLLFVSVFSFKLTGTTIHQVNLIFQIAEAHFIFWESCLSELLLVLIIIRQK